MHELSKDKICRFMGKCEKNFTSSFVPTVQSLQDLLEREINMFRKRVLMAVYAGIFMAALFLTDIQGGIIYGAKAQSVSGTSRLDVVRDIIDIINGKAMADGKKLSVKLKKTGRVVIDGKGISAGTVKRTAKKYDLGMKEAQYILAGKSLGLIDKQWVKNCRKPINYKDLLIILARTERLMSGTDFSSEDIAYVLMNRISNINIVEQESEQRLIASAYMSGYYAGDSDGYYTGTRSFCFKKKPTMKAVQKLLARITDKEKRYKLSSDWQLLRISDKNMPVMAAYYQYILEDYPNEYYDREFEFMQKNALVMPGKISAEFGNHTLTIRKAAWDNVLKYQKYNYRSTLIINYIKAKELQDSIRRDDTGVIRLLSQFIYPKELGRFLSLQKDENIKNIPESDTDFEEMIRRAVEYTYNVFNVDYRTISDRTIFYAGNSAYSYNSDYVTDCISNETVIECDRVVADPSAIYYQLNYTHNALQGYVIRLYVHYRVVNDNGRGDSALVNNLYFDERGASLRKVTPDDTGLRYKWAGNDGEWRDGYFDVSIKNNNGQMYTYYDLGRTENHITELMGGPEYNASYPGNMTFMGAVYCEEAFGEYYSNVIRTSYSLLLEKYKEKYGMYK